MHISSKGQITIPQEIRNEFGLFPDTEVEFIKKGNEIILKKIEGKNIKGKKIISHMRGKATIKMRTDEIMALTRGERD